MCRTQRRELHYDSLTTTIQNEYHYTTGYHPTSPQIIVGFEPGAQSSTQPTPERSYDESITQIEPLGEQERAYVRTAAFTDDDMMARLGLDLGTEAQDGGPSHSLALNIPPQRSEPSTSEPLFPPADATAQTSTGFDAIRCFDPLIYIRGLDEPLPTSTGWDPDPQLPRQVNGVVDTSFIVPGTAPWSSWPGVSANEGLNRQESATTGLSPGIVVPVLSQQLLLGPQGHTIDPTLTTLQPPQPGRPRANTAPTVLRDVTPNTLLSYPLGSPMSYPPGSPISVPPSTPRDIFGSECGSSASSSPFSQTHELPSYGNHPGSNSPRFRSASVSTGTRGRPLTRPRRMVHQVLDPARLRPHLPLYPDIQGPTPSSILSTPQHLDVPSTEWACGGSDISDYNPDSPSTPSGLSRNSSTSSVHRQTRPRSRSGTPYFKPPGVAAGDGITGNLGLGISSTEYAPKRKRNGEFPGQRLHYDKKFLESALGDEPPLRKLLDNILGSLWRKNHTLEPNYGANDDDVSQGLDLPIEQGSSVLLAFIRENGDEYTCILCKGAVSPRVPRQLGHVRGHIDLRPFACTGCDSCDPKHPGRFFSNDLLQDHHRSSRSGECLCCGEKMRQHNLKRHVLTKHPHLNGDGVPCVKDFTSQWETAPFLTLPAFEPFGLIGHSTNTYAWAKGHRRVPSAS